MDGDALDIRALGRAIREKREEIGLSENRLAKRAGTGRGFLVKVEAGISEAGLDVLVRIARALRITVDDLLAKAGVESNAAIVEELGLTYADLDTIQRGTLIGISRLLRDQRLEYSLWQRENAEPEKTRKAAPSKSSPVVDEAARLTLVRLDAMGMATEDEKRQLEEAERVRESAERWKTKYPEDYPYGEDDGMKEASQDTDPPKPPDVEPS